MHISELYSIYQQYPLISTDSRAILPESLFFALKGANFNGNEFAKKTVDNGCPYAIVDEEAHVYDSRFILVKDVLKSLQELARYHREQIQIPVLGITGTNGKTTTKELLSVILAKKFSVVYTKGNLNNHIGVPLTVLSIKPETEIAIVEMGANHPGEIGFLCEIAKPTHGLITNIGKAHLEGFGSFEGVKNTKNELYDYLFSHNGIVYANSGNIILKDLIKNRPCVTYGSDDGDYCKGTLHVGKTYLEAGIEICINPTDVLQQLISQKKININILSNLVGAYNLENLLAAVTIGYNFGVDATSIRDAILKYHPDNNRSQLLTTEKNTIIMDAYNANPSSMEVAIQNFISLQDENKAAIFGEMLELGDYSNEEHLKILDLIKGEKMNPVYLVGKSFCALKNTEFECFEDVDLLCQWIQKNPIQGRKILIKGSRGNKLEKVLPYL